MIPYNQVVNGVTRYIDSEIVPKVNGFSKLAVAVVLAGAVKNAGNTVEQIKTMPIIKMTGLIDEENMVDIETIYEELKKQVAREPISMVLPGVGKVTFNHDDIDKMYSHIMGGAV
jgi:hypothetical protein